MHQKKGPPKWLADVPIYEDGVFKPRYGSTKAMVNKKPSTINHYYEMKTDNPFLEEGRFKSKIGPIEKIKNGYDWWHPENRDENKKPSTLTHYEPQPKESRREWWWNPIHEKRGEYDKPFTLTEYNERGYHVDHEFDKYEDLMLCYNDFCDQYDVNKVSFTYDNNGVVTHIDVRTNTLAAKENLGDELCVDPFFLNTIVIKK